MQITSVLAMSRLLSLGGSVGRPEVRNLQRSSVISIPPAHLWAELPTLSKELPFIRWMELCYYSPNSSDHYLFSSQYLEAGWRRRSETGPWGKARAHVGLRSSFNPASF
jgi:hypothetical protein